MTAANESAGITVIGSDDKGKPTFRRWEADPAGQRTSMQMLESMCALLEEGLAVNRHILACLSALNDGAAMATNEPRESRSNVEIKTSTRGVDVSVKSYVASDVAGQVGPAVDAYFEALQQIEPRLKRATA